MINQISINSSNTIQLSRGQLLLWLNELLNINITKIQQLGTGAIYCQLLEVLYPTKVQLSKVNFKAKNDYEYISNFKILQQSFTKLSVMKHIQVEKLIKCKYQDNLEFLQWFKKIFDNSGFNANNSIGGNSHNTSKGDFDVMSKRSVSQADNQSNIQKENKRPVRALNFSAMSVNNDNQKNINSNLNDLLKLHISLDKGAQKYSQASTSRNNDKKNKQSESYAKPSTQRPGLSNENESETNQRAQNQQIKASNNNMPQNETHNQNAVQHYYSPSKYLQKESFFRAATEPKGLISEEKQYYLKKFKQIEHLLQLYEDKPEHSTLVNSIRKIILMPPSVKEWKVNQQTGQIEELEPVPQSQTEQTLKQIQQIQEKQQTVVQLTPYEVIQQLVVVETE